MPFIAALNWYGIAAGFARAQVAGSASFASAEMYAQRYAFTAQNRSVHRD